MTGYQFPFASEREKRFSWHMVEGEARTSEGAWRFRYPTLTCQETPMVAMWLTAVADWLSDPDGGPAPARLNFTEPNLSLWVDEKRHDHVLIGVDLAQEFKPPWLRTGDATPYRLRLTQGVTDMRRAAAAWVAESRAYPDEFDPVTNVS